MRRLRLKELLALAALASIAAANSASAASIIMSDNFDSYANQAAFQAPGAWPAIGTVAPTSALHSSAQSTSAPFSVLVPAEPDAPAGANGKSRNRRSFADSPVITAGPLGTPVGTELFWSFDFYDSNGAGAPARQYANLQDTTAPGSTNQLISMGLNNNQTAANSGGNRYMARILGYTVPTVDPDGGPNESVTGAAIYFKLNDTGAGLRTTGWHNLKVRLATNDGLSTDYYFYVDNVLAETVLNVGTAAQIRAYDNIVIGSGFTNANRFAHFDNMHFVVPEPATFILAGIGLAGVGFMARRRVA